jgi:hypothetical protein
MIVHNPGYGANRNPRDPCYISNIHIITPSVIPVSFLVSLLVTVPELFHHTIKTISWQENVSKKKDIKIQNK